MGLSAHPRAVGHDCDRHGLPTADYPATAGADEGRATGTLDPLVRALGRAVERSAMTGQYDASLGLPD